jgi:cytochrome c oxidase subunit 2
VVVKSPSRRRPGPARTLTRLLILSAALLSLAGCTGAGAKWVRGAMPAPVTEQGKRVLQLWQGSLVAALAVGAFVSFLIVFACIFYRRRSDELPRQVRYNLPIEVVYTVVPTIIVAILFYFTAVDENYVDKLTPNPDVTIHVVGFQWAWQFDYVQQGFEITGRPGDLPTLTVPTGKKIRFILTSPDVVHSFWVIPFLFKRDVIPGRENQFEVTVTKTGWWAGKCTELCGVDHDRMLFRVHAVSWSQYQQFLTSTRALAASGTNPMFTLVPSSTINVNTTGNS